MIITANYDIHAATIASLMVSAVECGAISYWCSSVYPVRPGTQTPDRNALKCGHHWYSEEGVYSDTQLWKWNIAFETPEPPKDGGPTVYMLTQEAMRDGLNKMANSKQDGVRARFMEIVGGTDCDNVTADVFVQMCLFGELIYG